ncbi:MAG: hypothetical protein JXJ17_00230 [Anaerolineae bacterium]|nr:hypothetical protein [Anaerolineae bacterium]
MKATFEDVLMKIVIGIAIVGSIVIAGYFCFLVLFVIVFDADYNPSAKKMTEYFNANQSHFEEAIPIMMENKVCSYTCPAPDEIREWAGEDAYFYNCYGKEDPPMYDLATEGGIFTYIPDQESIPGYWSPCTAVNASCSDQIAGNWFRCRRSFD